MRESRELMVGEYALQFEIGGVEFKEETIEINDEIARLEILHDIGQPVRLRLNDIDRRIVTTPLSVGGHDFRIGHVDLDDPSVRE